MEVGPSQQFCLVPGEKQVVPSSALQEGKELSQQTDAPLLHVPWPLHVSPEVQALLSLHEVPAGAFASAGQEPPEQYSATSQVPAPRHSCPAVLRVHVSGVLVVWRGSHFCVTQL